jgi:hypothetical protein
MSRPLDRAMSNSAGTVALEYDVKDRANRKPVGA